MQPMNTAWPWSSQACAISGIEIRHTGLIALLVFAFVFSSFAVANCSIVQVQAGQDIQKALDAANAGDIVVLGPGAHSSFYVDKPLTILGEGEPLLQAAIQRPAIRVNSDGVTISGFKILGAKKDTTAKFDYYMNNPQAASGRRLDRPNSAIVVQGSGFVMNDTSIFGAQVGLQAENVENVTLQNISMDTCDTGASLMNCRYATVEGCHITNCKKYGLDIEQSRDITLMQNEISDNANAGALLKKSELCSVSENIFSQNTFGLSLWNVSFCEIKQNQVDHNYYGILVTDWSCNNTIIENVVEDNSQSEIVKGFGVGISLQENSSHNLVVRNTAKRNFNGLEVSRRCKYNAVYGNNASENNHGIRMNENRNNLVFGNNFYSNQINAYENTSLNIWNTTFGNYYSNYRGKDHDADGFGDELYSLPGPESETSDYRPLVRPYLAPDMDLAALADEVKKYAKYGPAYDEIPTARMVGGTVVISSRIPNKPPKWSDSEPLDLNVPPSQKSAYWNPGI